MIVVGLLTRKNNGRRQGQSQNKDKDEDKDETKQRQYKDKEKMTEEGQHDDPKTSKNNNIRATKTEETTKGETKPSLPLIIAGPK